MAKKINKHYPRLQKLLFKELYDQLCCWKKRINKFLFEDQNTLTQEM